MLMARWEKKSVWKKLGSPVLVMLPIIHVGDQHCVPLALRNRSEGEFKHNWGTAEKLYKSEVGQLEVGLSPFFWDWFLKQRKKASKMDVGRKNQMRNNNKNEKRLCLFPFWKEETRCWESHTSPCFCRSHCNLGAVSTTSFSYMQFLETFVASIQSSASSSPRGFHMVSPWSCHWASALKKKYDKGRCFFHCVTMFSFYLHLIRFYVYSIWYIYIYISLYSCMIVHLIHMILALSVCFRPLIPLAIATCWVSLRTRMMPGRPSMPGTRSTSRWGFSGLRGINGSMEQLPSKPARARRFFSVEVLKSQCPEEFY